MECLHCKSRNISKCDLFGSEFIQEIREGVVESKYIPIVVNNHRVTFKYLCNDCGFIMMFDREKED